MRHNINNNIIIEILLISLIIFTPLAFGSVQLWSWTIIELAAIFLVFIWMLKMIKQGALTFVKTPLNLPIFAFLFLALIQLLPFFKSISPYAARTEFLKLLAYAAIFFVLVNNVTSRKQVNRLIISIILVGSFEAVYGLLEYLSRHQHIFFYQKKCYTNCVTGTYINRNHFAGYLEMVIPIAVSFALVAVWEPCRNTALSWKNKLVAMDKHVAKAGLFMFSALIMMTAVMFSTSRLGIFSMAVSLLIMTCFLVVMRKTKVFVWLICIVIGITGLSAIFIGLSPISSRYSLLSQHLAAGSSRPTVWRDTINIIKDFPILGTGLGTFVHVYPKYKTAKIRRVYDHAHNDYLEFLTETGVIGGIIAGMAIIIFIANLLKTLKSQISTRRRLVKIGILTSFIAIAIHSLGDFNLRIPANALLLFILAGLACCDSAGENRKFAISGRKTKQILSLALGVCLVLAVIVVARPAVADYFQRKGLQHEKNGCWKSAEKYYQKAVNISSDNPDSRIALAKAILFSKGSNISQADSYMKHLKSAAAQQPNNPYINYLMGYGYILSWENISEEERKRAINNLQYSLKMKPKYSTYAYRAIWSKLKDFSLMQGITPKTLAGQKRLLDFVQQNGLWQHRKEQNKLVEKYREIECPKMVKQEKLTKLEEIKEFKKEVNAPMTNQPTAFVPRKEWKGKTKNGRSSYQNGQMFWDGTIRTCLNLLPSKALITIKARGSSAKNIYSYMLVDLDEVRIGESAVSRDWKDYSFEVETQGSLRVLSVSFINDGGNTNPKEDRNLYIGDVSVSYLQTARN